MPSHHITCIPKHIFDAALARYPSAAPENLRELDALRYNIIPASVAKRKDAKFLEKNDVEKLVEWKLKHGTFRPKLLQLVQSNSEDLIKECTTEAFALLASSHESRDIIAALKILVKLKGVGPATASLLLSVADDERVPFFSDELFRWCMWDEVGSPGGWKRGIKYNVKEYEALLGRVGDLRERLEVRAVDVERVAWVLGKERVDIGADGGKDEDEGAGAADEKEVDEISEKTILAKPTKGTKRKAIDSASTVKGTRKSARTKK